MTPNCRSNSALVRLSSVKVGADFCHRAAFAVLLSVSLTLQAAPIRVAVSEFADYSVNLPVIPATIAVLEETFGKENVETRVYSVANLLAAAKTGQFDFMLTSAGAFRRLSIEGAGAVNLATVASSRAPNPNFADGSVFFALKDREDIREIADLRGRTVAANHKNGFSGWQTAMGEVLRRGFDPDTFFSDVHFKGHDMPQVVSAVLTGEVDAGIVRACFLEDIGADLSRFRILDPLAQDGRIDCVTSTALYPNWTFSTLPTTPPEVSRRVAAALLAMEPIENGLHWGIATDFRPIDRLFLDLKIGPYEYLRTFSFWRFVQEHSLAFAVLLTGILALLLHSVTVGALVRRRTAALERAMARERLLESESRDAQARYEAIQKAGIVGQMSSIIAHELRQPLASISMYAFGLLRRLENGTDSRDVTAGYLEKIGRETKRASDIVDQVRAYAKGNRVRTPQDLTRLLAAAVSEVEKSFRRENPDITFVRPHPEAGPVTAEVNALEIELIAVNLMKNSLDAMAQKPHKRVRLTLARRSGYADITVEDDGDPISDDLFTSIVKQSGRTTKEKGLGLGLSIIRSITEDMGGRVTFSRTHKGSLLVKVSLPLAESREGGSEPSTDQSADKSAEQSAGNPGDQPVHETPTPQS